MDINLGYARLYLPSNIGGWRYCLKNPSAFLIGVYGFKRFRELRSQLSAERHRVAKLEQQISIANEKLRERGKELSALKRSTT